ncbi:unnamed protein product [Rotaria sp. Silwood1]|nr:unnamed protein product [Rotaria sp. Silwood1]
MYTRYTDLWQLARTFGGHTKKCIDDNQILALGIIIGRMFSKSLNSPKAADFPTCGISSWGILPFDEQYGQWKFEGMTPIINMVQGFMPFITIQTVNGILSIMFSGPHPVIPFNVLEQLRQSTIDKLLSLL